uniref:Uncharacterized protein n=1 Tax=Eutreptiella gymnastica TaxID=73025 RepID=A0A7S1IH93_9EUGL|mmetsp:Transcript_18484/g.32810  ORF Transcript_18484/g.32810 Transcript_18484/m.32810 type:complete len:104 (+) Transcript_18484:88-399(+)
MERLGDKPATGLAVAAHHGMPPAPTATAKSTIATPEHVVSEFAAFAALMHKYLILMPYYTSSLKELGYDRIETLKHIAANIVSINMMVGHRQFLPNAVSAISA